MTYLNARRRAEIMTVIMLFREIVVQCIKGGDPENTPRLAPVCAHFDMALVEAMAGLNTAGANKALDRAKRAATAILKPWVEAKAAVPRVYLMADVWLKQQIDAGRFELSDGPFLDGYNLFAAMIEDSDEGMKNLSDPRLQRSALKGVDKLDAAFQERFGA